MNWLLKHLWPFSEIRELRRQLRALNENFMKQWDFGKACCAYLDEVHAPWKHLQMGGKLYIMGVDSTHVMEKCEVDVMYFRDAEGGIQEFRCVSKPEDKYYA